METDRTNAPAVLGPLEAFQRVRQAFFAPRHIAIDVAQAL